MHPLICNKLVGRILIFTSTSHSSGCIAKKVCATVKRTITPDVSKRMTAVLMTAPQNSMNTTLCVFSL